MQTNQAGWLFIAGANLSLLSHGYPWVFLQGCLATSVHNELLSTKCIILERKRCQEHVVEKTRRMGISPRQEQEINYSTK